jgi:hypothetical protein
MDLLHQRRQFLFQEAVPFTLDLLILGHLIQIKIMLIEIEPQGKDR